MKLKFWIASKKNQNDNYSVELVKICPQILPLLRFSGWAYAIASPVYRDFRRLLPFWVKPNKRRKSLIGFRQSIGAVGFRRKNHPQF